MRVVQVWSGAGQPWDNHDNLEQTHKNLAAQWDQPIAAFLTDLKVRGLFDSTLVHVGRRVRPHAGRGAAGNSTAATTTTTASPAGSPAAA